MKKKVVKILWLLLLALCLGLVVVHVFVRRIDYELLIAAGIVSILGLYLSPFKKTKK